MSQAAAASKIACGDGRAVAHRGEGCLTTAPAASHRVGGPSRRGAVRARVAERASRRPGGGARRRGLPRPGAGRGRAAACAASSCRLCRASGRWAAPAGDQRGAIDTGRGGGAAAARAWIVVGRPIHAPTIRAGRRARCSPRSPRAWAAPERQLRLTPSRAVAIASTVCRPGCGHSATYTRVRGSSRPGRSREGRSRCNASASVGTGYVGLVTGTCLADFGNEVTCRRLWTRRRSPCCSAGRHPLLRTSDPQEVVERKHARGAPVLHDRRRRGDARAQVIFSAVGHPRRPGGSGQTFSQVSAMARTVAENLNGLQAGRCRRGTSR